MLAISRPHLRSDSIKRRLGRSSGLARDQLVQLTFGDELAAPTLFHVSEPPVPEHLVDSTSANAQASCDFDGFEEIFGWLSSGELCQCG
jgi:hypothetical protein